MRERERKRERGTQVNERDREKEEEGEACKHTRGTWRNERVYRQTDVKRD